MQIIFYFYIWVDLAFLASLLAFFDLLAFLTLFDTKMFRLVKKNVCIITRPKKVKIGQKTAKRKAKNTQQQQQQQNQIYSEILDGQVPDRCRTGAGQVFNCVIIHIEV